MAYPHSLPREGANCDHGSRSVEGAVWDVSGTVLPKIGRVTGDHAVPGLFFSILISELHSLTHSLTHRHCCTEPRGPWPVTEFKRGRYAMADRRLNTRQMAIKEAFRDLIDAAGGQKRVAAITRACRSVLSKQASPNDADHFPSVDVVADLEADTGLRAITSLLADMAGCDLVPRAGTVRPESMMTDAGRMALAFGDLQHKFMAALADGRLDPVEQARVRGAIKDLRDRINTFDAQTATASTVRAVK